MTVIIGASAGGLCVFVILVAMVIWKVKKRNPYEELDWTDAEDRYDGNYNDETKCLSWHWIMLKNEKIRKKVYDI